MSFSLFGLRKSTCESITTPGPDVIELFTAVFYVIS